MNDVARAAGEQGRDSNIHVDASILPQTLLPSGLPHTIEHPVPYSRSL